MNYDRPASVLSRLAYRYVHTLVDALILYSDQEIGHVSPMVRKKVFVASNTINHEAYPQIHHSRQTIKHDLNIPFDKVVLSVGRMGADGGRKKIDHLIRVFRELTCTSFGLVIVGSGVTADQAQDDGTDQHLVFRRSVRPERRSDQQILSNGGCILHTRTRRARSKTRHSIGAYR